MPLSTTALARIHTDYCESRDPGLRRELATHYLPMAHRLARKHRGRGELLEDLEGVAALGLLLALERYEPARGSFVSYAIPTIRGELQRHHRDRTMMLRFSRELWEAMGRAGRAQERTGPGGEEPELSEIEQEAMAALDARSPLSLDKPVLGTDQGITVSDSVGGLDPAFEMVEVRDLLDRLDLSERERVVLILRAASDYSQREVAEYLGLSQMSVSRAERSILERIERSLGGEEEAIPAA